MKEIMTYTEYREQEAKRLGITPTDIKIERIEDVFEGVDKERALTYKRNYCEPNQCHYNSALLSLYLKDWKISFCEGYINDFIKHCWNKVENKNTGEIHYIDFTLDREQDAVLYSVWEENEILNLFNVCKFSFIPFDGYWLYIDKKKAKTCLTRHYPNLEASLATSF